MKYKIKNPENQAQSPEKLRTDTCSIWTQLKKSLYNLLVHFDNRYQYSFPSQTCLALLLGCSRQTVNRLIRELLDEGWLTTIFRPRKTSFYILPSIFNDYSTRFKFASIFSNFRYLKLAILMVAQNVDLEASATPSIKESFIYKSVIRNSYVIRNTKTYNRKRESNMHYDIPFYVEEITEIPLTQMGKIRLSTFNETTITAARKLYAENKTKPRNPATWFIKLCEDYAKEHTLHPNWKLFFGLKEQYGLTGKEPYIELKGLTTAQASTPKSFQQEGRDESGPAVGSIEWQIDRCKQDIAKYQYLYETTGSTGAHNALRMTQEKLARYEAMEEKTEAEQVVDTLIKLSRSTIFEDSFKTIGKETQIKLLSTFVEKPDVLTQVWASGDEKLIAFVRRWYVDQRESMQTKEDGQSNTNILVKEETSISVENSTVDRMETVADKTETTQSDNRKNQDMTDNRGEYVNIIQDYTQYEEVEDCFIDEQVKQGWSLPF